MRHPLNILFIFKGNIPSVCDLRIGESYDNYYSHLKMLQDRLTGDLSLDIVLNKYSIFIDTDTDSNGRISEISLKISTYSPFSSSDMKEIISFFSTSFKHNDYTYSEHHMEDVESYECNFADDKYIIHIQTENEDSDLAIVISAHTDDVRELQGANTYYYHERLGIYGVKGAELSLSHTSQPGVLDRNDVVENLIEAMNRNNEYGDDWHFDYAYSFLHQAGTILPLEDKTLLKDEDYIRMHAEEMTDIYGERGGQAEWLLKIAGVGKALVPIEELWKDELLEGYIIDIEDHYLELSSEWTLGQLLPYESHDF